jgi:hypothetical protein
VAVQSMHGSCDDGYTHRGCHINGSRIADFIYGRGSQINGSRITRIS